MPDRILRSGLFSSDSWLALKNNDDRVCWIALFETSDNLGNQPAGPFRLIRIWRPYGIDTPEKVAKVLMELADVDLVRTYQVDGKPYVNIPRFGQSTRFPGFLYPIPPFSTNEQKQIHAKKSRVIHGDSQRFTEDHGDSPAGVGVGVGVEPNISCASATPDARGVNKNVNNRKHVNTASTSFDVFWSSYPKKKSKGSAEKAWNMIKPDAALCQQIMTALDKAKAGADWKRDAGQYIPYPSTWLNNRGWEDEITPAVTPSRRVAL